MNLVTKNNINIFHLNGKYYDLASKWNNNKRTSASESLCLKSYIQFWRLRMDNILGVNRYAYR